MTTVVFVHGTGVREPRFSSLCARVGAELRRRAPAVRLVPYGWGGEHGATLAAGGVSVPYDATARAAASAPGVITDAAADAGGDREAADEADAEQWAARYADPFAELAAAASGPAVPAETPPGAVPPGERWRERLTDLAAELPRTGGRVVGLPADALADAAATVGRSPLLGPASATPDGEALARLLARTVVAVALGGELERDSPLIPGAPDRDAVVADLTARLGARPDGSDRGVAAVLARPLVRLASRHAVRRRRALTDAAYPAAGDVLRYLARGEPVRRGLQDLVATVPPPVVLLGHSLGGIIALDTLLTAPMPTVAGLVTVGSQGPFLYETGALPGLVHPDPLPAHLPRWLNLYDPRDLLAYVGEPLFPGRVRDLRVTSRQPFPAAHSAYFTNPDVYRAIAGELP